MLPMSLLPSHGLPAMEARWTSKLAPLNHMGTLKKILPGKIEVDHRGVVEALERFRACRSGLRPGVSCLSDASHPRTYMTKDVSYTGVRTKRHVPEHPFFSVSSTTEAPAVDFVVMHPLYEQFPARLPGRGIPPQLILRPHNISVQKVSTLEERMQEWWALLRRRSPTQSPPPMSSPSKEIMLPQAGHEPDEASFPADMAVIVSAASLILTEGPFWLWLTEEASIWPTL